MSFLAALAKNQKKQENRPVSAVALIEEHLLLTDLSDDRRDRKFHPSELAGAFCPRAWSLYNYHPEGYSLKESGVDPKLARIFGNGHDVHSRIQRYLGGSLWGLWRKQVGWEDEKDLPVFLYERGFRPKGNGWEYAELLIRHDPDRIIGSTDGLLYIPGSGKWGLEVKSINPEGFRFLQDRPKGIHLNQLYVYEHGLEWKRLESGEEPVDDFDAEPLRGFIVLYENKGTQDLKEFALPYDPHPVEQFITGRRLLMDEALEFERTGEHPGCTCDPKKMNPLCKAVPDPHRFSRMIAALTA